MPGRSTYSNWLILMLLAMALQRPLPAQEYYFSHLTSRDGLASNTVQAITQDRDGFWWFGTTNGLQRFDGQAFRTYRHVAGDSTSLPDDIVVALFSDRAGRLWVGTAKGLCRFDREKEIFQPAYTLDGEIVARRPSGVYRLLEASRDVLWLGSVGLGILRYLPERDRWEQVVFPGGPERLFLGDQPTEDSVTGDIWFCDRFGLGYVDRRRNRIVLSRDEPQAHPAFAMVTSPIAVLIDRENNLWVIDPDSLKLNLYGILRYNLRTGACRRYELHVFGNLFLDSRGKIWITTRNNSVGLGWYDRERDTIRLIQRRPGDPYSIRYGWAGLLTWYEDREGNIWLGSTEGISVFNPYDQRFFALPDPESGKEEWEANALCFLETRQGEIWIGTYFGGLYVLDRDFRFLRRIHYSPGKKAPEEGPENFNAIWALHQSRDGDIWAGGQHGTLQRFSAGGKLLGRWQPPELRRETIRCIFEDESGDLWLGTQKGTLVRLKLNSGRFSRFSLKPGCWLLRALPAEANTFWLASGCESIFQWDAAAGTLVKTITPTEPLTGSQTGGLSTHCLSPWNDTLLLVGGTSLFFYNTKTGSINFPEGLEALPSRSITFFQILSPGEVWIGTGTRLVRWAPQRRKITEFGPADGIRAETFDNLNSVLRLSDGRILFSGSNRVYSFHPARISGRNPPPPAVITAVRAGKRSLDAEWPAAGRVGLPYQQNFLTIEFATLSWRQRDDLSYECRLLGLEDDWQDYGPNRQAGYVRLFPGRYTFQVRARNADGLASEAVTELAIRIRPPVWLRWWFLALAALALFLAARWGIRSHYRRKAELQRLELAHRLALEQERLRIARDMHDDLGSGISALGLQAEIARRRTRSRPAAAEFDKIARSAAGLAVRIRETIWLINSRNDTLDHLTSFLYQYASELLENTGLAWTFHLPSEIPHLIVPGELRRAVLLTFREALNNALRHAAAARLEIDLRLDQQTLFLTVADDGRGMDVAAARRKNGNGLRNMEERMAAAGGAFRIESGAEGTRVRLELPL